MSKLTRLVPPLLLLLGAVTNANATQTCHSETQIPSSTPTGAFTDHGDGSLTHQATGLMWMKCPLGQSGADCASGSANGYTWEAALAVADASAHAGHTDWRLPDVNELRSIVETRCVEPSINGTMFPNTPTSFFWSSSPDAYYSFGAWYVGFSGGYSGNDYRSSDLRVRLVRSGQ